MSAKHMSLKRISHRIKEEIASTIEVARVLNLKSAFGNFRGKSRYSVMVYNGHIEHPWDQKTSTEKTEAMMPIC